MGKGYLIDTNPIIDNNVYNYNIVYVSPTGNTTDKARVDKVE